MKITLRKAGPEDAELIWKMQVEAFKELLVKYEDYDLNPAAELLDKTIMRLNQSFTYFYFIESNGEKMGAIRVVDKKEEGKPKRISPIFVMPPYRGKGIAQMAIMEAERIHGSDNWELDTILQEAGNCHLYEKLGYRQTGETEKINDKMTLVFYRK